MTPRTLVYTALLMAVIAAAGVVVMDGASAAQPQIPSVSLVGNEATTDCMDRAPAARRQIPGVSLVGSEATRDCVQLGVGKSLVYDFSHDIKNVLVADPKIANAVILSSRRAYIISNAPGATNIVFFDAEGKQMARFEITVPNGKPVINRDVTEITNAIRRYIPNSYVGVESVGDGIILSGTVANPLEAQQAYDIAAHYVDPCAALGQNDSGSISSGSSGSGTSGGSSSLSISSGSPCGAGSSASGGGVKGALNGVSSSKIVNLIVVSARDQVVLKVTVAEIDREVIKQLGINLSGSAGFGSAVLNFNNNAANPNIAPGYSPPSFPVNGTPSNTFAGGFKGLTATLQAMEQVGVVRTLAEPTLTAISGESAHFLVGGSFPYPVPAALGQIPGISFQNYGVSLNFTPVVLSDGRISLHVATEVSQLDPTTSVVIQGTEVPGLLERRADTTAEVPSGGSLVMAGMLQDQTKQTIKGLPGVMEVPILGTLFKSRDYLNNRTELVILVTPYISHPVLQKDVSRPDDGFSDPSDPASVLLGRLNCIYGVIASPPDLPYHGKIGFILD